MKGKREGGSEMGAWEGRICKGRGGWREGRGDRQAAVNESGSLEDLKRLTHSQISHEHTASNIVCACVCLLRLEIIATL